MKKGLVNSRVTVKIRLEVGFTFSFYGIQEDSDVLFVETRLFLYENCGVEDNFFSDCKIVLFLNFDLEAELQ